MWSPSNPKGHPSHPCQPRNAVILRAGPQWGNHENCETHEKRPEEDDKKMNEFILFCHLPVNLLSVFPLFVCFVYFVVNRIAPD